MFKLNLWLPVFCLACTLGQAQDLHFSQFYLHPLHLSPAQTGIFRGEIRASAIYRNQWKSVPVDYRTFGAACDLKALRRGTFLVNGGLLVQQDKAGDAGLSWTQLGLSGSVAHALGESQALSVGVSASFVQRSFDLENLKFKNQWTGEVFDPSRPTMENLDRSSGFAPSLAAGLNWHFEPGSDGRTTADVGLGAFHLNRPNLNFDPDDDFKLPMRMAFTASGSVKLSENQDLVAFAAVQQMQKNREIVAGGGARHWLRNVPGRQTAVQLTVGVRAGDAFIPALQLIQNSWTLGFSYDVNISAFDVATNKRGGPEVAVVYRVVKAPPAKAFKVCPIF